MRRIGSLLGLLGVGAILMLAPSIAPAGRVVVEGGGLELVNDVAFQDDGKVVVAGFTSVGNNGVVYRLKPNGKLDKSFGDQGVAILDSGAQETVNAVAIQDDGKIVVAGSTTAGGSYDGAVYRLRRNGTLDPSFDTDGALGIDTAGEEQLRDIAIRPNGKIVVVGESFADDGQAVIYQLEENGGNGTINDGLDDTFAGGDGVFGIAGGIATSVALQKDGKIVVGSQGSAGAVYRIKKDGASLDQSFGKDGRRRLGNEVIDTTLAVQRDGRIVVGVWDGSPHARAVVLRLTENGRQDKGFGTGGERRIGFGDRDAGVGDLVMAPGGTILVTGHTSRGSDYDAFVAKLKRDGSFDRSFKGNGKRILNHPAVELGFAIAFRNGRILVGCSNGDGGPEPDAVVYGLTGDGASDKRFGQ